MKLNVVEVIDNKDGIDHHFDIGQRVLLIQDFARTDSGLNCFFKVCFGTVNWDDQKESKGIQTIDETSLKVVDTKEYPEVNVVGFYQDEEEVVGADIGTFDTFGYDNERKKKLVGNFIESLNELDRIAPKSIDKYHLIVAKDSDGDFVYTVIPENYLKEVE